jgi:hypothetical protein
VKRAIPLLWLALATVAAAQWNASSLGSFGFATLPDNAAGERLATRFRAHGDPVFLIGNPSQGLQMGDIMRFSDRAVLIDGDVWQTLKAEGALAKLQVAPVVRVKARAAKDAWSARSQAVKGDEKKAYELGERLLKSMDGVMPVLPDGQKLSLSFEGGQMVLMVPPAFLDKFRLQNGEGIVVRKSDPESSRDRPIPRGTPRIVFPDAGQVFVGSPLKRPAWAVDDSGGPTADLRLWCEGTLPPGVAWNATSRTLEGIPTKAGDYASLLRAVSPGGSDSLPVLLSVRKNHPPVFLNTPDSANRGESWSFRPAVGDSDQPVSRLRLSVRKLPLGAKWDSLSSTVTWTPADTLAAASRILSLAVFDPLGDSSVGIWTIGVAKPIEMPIRFLSELGQGDPRVDVPLSYLPVAVSGRGDSVRMQAVLPAGSPMAWDGHRLTLRATAPGLYPAELVAQDDHGHVSKQMVAWDVRPAHRTTVFVETRYQADMAPSQVGVDFGTGRLGLFTPSIGRLFGWSSMQDQEWPYVFLGANLLDEAARARGNRLTADLGLTVRLPKSSLYTGGFCARLSGKLVANSPIPIETEFDVQGWIRQAMMIADSNVLVTVSLTPSQQAQFKVNDARWTPTKMITIQDSYWGAIQKTLDDARADDNVVLLSSLWGWTPVGAGLKAGAGVWRVDQPLAAIARQSLGLGLKGDWSLGRFRAEPSVRGGWGPQGAGFSAWGGLLLSMDASRGRR